MAKDNRKIATLWDNKEPEEADDNNQAFYAGGSEHSGQQIIGPNRGGFVEDLFRQASQSADSMPTGSSVTSLPIVFWRNGFTIGDDEELHSYGSSDNSQFLECLKRGETPPEIASRFRGSRNVDVNLVNKAHQDFKPSQKSQTFSGEGRRLGAPTPETVEEKPAESMASAEAPASNLVLDESKPKTTVQVRLVDNTRLVVTVNLSHLVGDLVSHIRAIRPEYSDTSFVLATTFPAKELTDLNQTIGDAKLANASVLQKIKRQ